jgi:hypothetical protein
MKIKKILIFFFVITVGLVSCKDDTDADGQHELLASDYHIFQGTVAWDLAKAIHDDDYDGIKQLVSKNKRLVNIVDPRYGQTLLGLAAYNEKYNSCKALVEAGADPNAFNNFNGETPLMAAAGVNNYNSGPDPRYLILLLKHGANPNLEQKYMDYSGSHGQTPISIACSIAALDYVKILINAGATLNYKEETVPSLLGSAMNSKNPDLVVYLIQKGIDYKQPTAVYWNPHKKRYITDDLRGWCFDLGSEKYKKKMEIVDFLKRNGIDYRKTKIPSDYYDQYDKNYLDRY